MIPATHEWVHLHEKLRSRVESLALPELEDEKAVDQSVLEDRPSQGRAAFSPREAQQHKLPKSILTAQRSQHGTAEESGEATACLLKGRGFIGWPSCGQLPRQNRL